MARKTLLSELRDYLQERGSRRAWALAAQDGIIATASILLGFAGAGAGDRTLLLAASAATVAGMLSAGGAAWSQAAAEREAELSAIREEKAGFDEDEGVDTVDIADYYEKKGLSRDLAERVAAQLMVRSPLKAALETEHGILVLTSRAEVMFTGIGCSLAFAFGASIPFALTFLLPVSIETWVIVLSVLVSLTLISIAGARAGYMDVRNTVVRTLTVGLITVSATYLLGEMAF